MGPGSGEISQGANAVALGRLSGQTNQGNSSVAIGSFSGYSSQPANTIILNASGNPVNGTTSNAFFVNPVRLGGILGTIPAGFYNMAYNPTTSEIIYWT